MAQLAALVGARETTEQRRRHKFEILNPKHETNPNFKFSNVQNNVESIYRFKVLVIWILLI
jgi:hypothetical protein